MRLVYSRLPSTRLCDQASGSPWSWVEVPVELDVFLVLDLGLGPRPQRRAAVDGLVFERRRALLRHAHREGDVIGIAPHQRAQAPGIEKLLRIVLQVQHDGVPRSVRSTVSTVNSPSALDSQRTPSPAARPARRVNTSTRSATMKAE